MKLNEKCFFGVLCFFACYFQLDLLQVFYIYIYQDTHIFLLNYSICFTYLIWYINRLQSRSSSKIFCTFLIEYSRKFSHCNNRNLLGRMSGLFVHMWYSLYTNIQLELIIFVTLPFASKIVIRERLALWSYSTCALKSVVSVESSLNSRISASMFFWQLK